MAQPVYVVNGPGEGLAVVALLMIPPLVPPGYLVYLTWVQLSVGDVHPLFKLLAAAGEIAAFFYCLSIFYRYVPPVLSIAATTIYMGVTFCWAFAHITDETWSLGVGVAAAVGGYFLGRLLAKDYGREPRKTHA